MYDKESEFYYLRARYYDPKIGLDISEDTYKGQVDNPLTLNRYTYVHNNPINNIDPTGNYCVSADGNWAHGGSCNDTTSFEVTDVKGSPIIEDGYKVGYLGISGPSGLW